MPRIVREATVTWSGSMARGVGAISAASSGAFAELPFSFPTRIGNPEGRTSPEELLAAAHGGCFAMSLSAELSNAELPPDGIDVRCQITMDEVEGKGHQIVGSAIVASATGPGIGAGELATALAAADAGCPFSTLLREAGATVEVTTTEGAS
ncbi:MAG: OsmC family peroxiredoxin [Gaiellales bacterium]